MLTSEQVEAVLKEARIEGEAKRRQEAVISLPGELGEIGALLFKSSSDWHENNRRSDEAAARLDSLPPSERERFFEILFPQLGRYVEGAWQLMARLPYQVGYARHAFRAPRNPEITRMARITWLRTAFNIANDYCQDITWFAAWAAYVARYGAGTNLAVLFSAAIDSGDPQGQQVYEILVASANGEHEIGAMGRHVVRALLNASRPEGWEVIERLLIAAQRQEGLRQVILETIDETHPAAFRRMIRLILDQDLLRFSATVRAVDVWFGMGWTVDDVATIRAFLQKLAHLMESPEVSLTEHDAEGIYMALWLMAHEDALSAVEPAQSLLADPDPERRFAAVHLLSQLGIDGARSALLPALRDDDLRVAVRALSGIIAPHDQRPTPDSLFEEIETLLTRLPAKAKTLQPMLWPWLALSADRESTADLLLYCLGDRSPKRLLPYLNQMSSGGRGRLAQMLDQMEHKDADVRHALLALVGDPARWTREAAITAVGKFGIQPDEAPGLEILLRRKATDLRRAVITLLLRQTNDHTLASAGRLLVGKDMERLAGLEILHLMAQQDRSVAEVRECAGSVQARSPEEEKFLAAIQTEDTEEATLNNALGLLDAAQKTPAVRPLPVQHVYLTETATRCVISLDILIGEHSRTPVILPHNNQEVIFGNLQPYYFQPHLNIALEEDLKFLPLLEVWEAWWADHPVDEDGLELIRALALAPAQVWVGRMDANSPVRPIAEVVLNNGTWEERLKNPQIVKAILQWLIRLHPPAGAADFLLDAAQTSFALLPEDDLGRMDVPTTNHYVSEPDLWWRRSSVVNAWLEILSFHRGMCSAEWTDEHHARLWRLLRWIDEPGVEAKRLRPTLHEVFSAYRAGAASDADVLDHLIGPRAIQRFAVYDFNDLRYLSGRKQTTHLPGVQAVIEQIRARVVEVEVRRGEMPTAASNPASALRAVFGSDALIRLIQALGKDDLQRGWSYDGYSKQVVLSHLIRVTLPRETDTPEDFARLVKAAKIPHKRLIEVAVYSPHWARFIEHVLGWAGFEDAVWWLHAHTKDQSWYVDPEVRELWTAEVAERTPLSGQNLVEGAVDVAWFHHVYNTLGPERWEAIYAAAKYAAGGTGHARATLFADAMLGRIEPEALTERFMKKRHQDSVRALGLLPISPDDILMRYESIQEFLRTGKKFGAQRKANEKLAGSIAMENLARTAGYPDPIRLEWAMEAQANADFAGGSLCVSVEDVVVTLAVNPWGEAEVSVEKKGKPVKAIPPRLKKEPPIAHLLERKQEIQRQTSRMRQSLEGAMCRGDAFTPGELRSLMSHPILRPMLEQLIFTGKSGMGYPVQGGRDLRRHDGSSARVRKNDTLRLAHPYDLLESRDWHEWQHECFVSERIQPFKQVFRELYVLTDTEKADDGFSRRYAGHQVQPRQAAALLGQRGWVLHPHEGTRRTFHEADISVWLSGNIGMFTPAEVEGAALEGIHFSKRGEWKAVPLDEVPPRVFSEAMRDIDLIVSVAHVGGVDPEASASTVEMRAALIHETARLLKLDNVRLSRSHALIEGRLGHYSIHLGSGIVHRQPGGALCIIPVHSQHRGRIFLPFADNDPRTAEVMSKVVLLSKDADIKDPTILEQLIQPH